MPDNSQDSWDLLTCDVGDDGVLCWFDETGRLHRENGPAIISPNGTQCWYRHGEIHRTDGPAILYRNGTAMYVVDGENMSKVEFQYRGFSSNVD